MDGLHDTPEAQLGTMPHPMLIWAPSGVFDFCFWICGCLVFLFLEDFGIWRFLGFCTAGFLDFRILGFANFSCLGFCIFGFYTFDCSCFVQVSTC